MSSLVYLSSFFLLLSGWVVLSTPCVSVACVLVCVDVCVCVQPLGMQHTVAPQQGRACGNSEQNRLSPFVYPAVFVRRRGGRHDGPQTLSGLETWLPPSRHCPCFPCGARRWSLTFLVCRAGEAERMHAEQQRLTVHTVMDTSRLAQRTDTEDEEGKGT